MPNPWTDTPEPADRCADLPDAPVPGGYEPAPGERLRTGRKVPLHLYLTTPDDPAGRPVGVVYHSPELAALVRDAVNDYLIAIDRRREREEVPDA